MGADQDWTASVEEQQQLGSAWSILQDVVGDYLDSCGLRAGGWSGAGSSSRLLPSPF